MAARRPPRDQVKPAARCVFGTQRRPYVYLRSRLLMSNAIAKAPAVASSLLACAFPSRRVRSPLGNFPYRNYFATRKSFPPRTPELPPPTLPRRFFSGILLEALSNRFGSGILLETLSSTIRGGGGERVLGKRFCIWVCGIPCKRRGRLDATVD